MSEVVYSFVPDKITGSGSVGGWVALGSFFNDQESPQYGRAMEIYMKIYGGDSFLEDNQLALSGSIVNQGVDFTRTKSQTQVTVTTAHHFWDLMGLQGIYFTNQVTPLNPHQMTDLTLGKIIYHILSQHSSLTKDTPGGWVDISNINTLTSGPVDVFTVKASSSMWRTCKDIAENDFYVLYCDKQDGVIYKPHPSFTGGFLGEAAPVVLDLNENNIIGMPQVRFRTELTVDYVLVAGADGAGNAWKAFYPEFPGSSFAYTLPPQKKLKIFNGVRAHSQAQVNELAQRAWAFESRLYDVTLSIPGPYGIFLELYDVVTITYTGTTANGVTIDWDARKFVIQELSINNVNDRNSATELQLTELIRNPAEKYA